MGSEPRPLEMQSFWLGCPRLVLGRQVQSLQISMSSSDSVSALRRVFGFALMLNAFFFQFRYRAAESLSLEAGGLCVCFPSSVCWIGHGVTCMSSMWLELNGSRAPVNSQRLAAGARKLLVDELLEQAFVKWCPLTAHGQWSNFTERAQNISLDRWSTASLSTR